MTGVEIILIAIGVALVPYMTWTARMLMRIEVEIARLQTTRDSHESRLSTIEQHLRTFSTPQ